MTRLSELALTFLLNAAWQITAVVFATALCARLLRRAPARQRHMLWLAALVLSVALPAWTLVDFTKTDLQLVAQNIALTQRTDNRPVARLSAAPASSFADVTNRDTTAAPQRLSRRRPITLSFTPVLAALVLGGYMLFVLLRLSMLLRAWHWARRVRRTARPVALTLSAQAVAARCRSALGLCGVPILCSREVRAPVTVGARAPVVILPEEFPAETQTEALASVLGHELAHVARRDYALNLACELLILSVSFHPLVAWTMRQLRRTRELACDELVAERVLEPTVYARALVRVAEALITPGRRTCAPGIFDANILEERVMRLLTNERRMNARAGLLSLLVIVALLTAMSLNAPALSFHLQPDAARAAQTNARPQAQTAAQHDVADTLRTLTAGDPTERAAAACALGRAHAVEAIPALVEMLGDDSPVAPVQCWTEGRWSPALSSFKQPTPGEQAAIALAAMGKLAVAPLVAALRDANPSVRRNAAWAIGEVTGGLAIDRSAAVMPLVALLRDADGWVRAAAARALGELRPARAGDELIAALADAHPLAREYAAWALGEMKDRRAVEGLSERLLNDNSAGVRAEAAKALGEIAAPEAAAALNKALNDSDERVRAEARSALAELEG